MPEFFSAVNAYQPAPFPPFDWNSTSPLGGTYNSYLLWRIDTNNTSCYPGTGTTLTSLAPSGGTWTVQGGPSFVTSGNTKYFAFDGVNDAFYSNLTSYNYFFNDSYFLAVWLWHDTAAINIKRAFASINDGFNDNLTYTINTSASGYGINIYVNTEGPATHGIAAIQPNTWNFIGIWRGGNSVGDPNYTGTFNTYLNGSWVSKVSNATSTSIVSERWILGADNQSGTAATREWMPGRITEAFFSNPIYTFTEVSTYLNNIYNGTKGRYGL
jgi:hypothetical protein